MRINANRSDTGNNQKLIINRCIVWKCGIQKIYAWTIHAVVVLSAPVIDSSRCGASNHAGVHHSLRAADRYYCYHSLVPCCKGTLADESFLGMQNGGFGILLMVHCFHIAGEHVGLSAVHGDGIEKCGGRKTMKFMCFDALPLERR